MGGLVLQQTQQPKHAAASPGGVVANTATSTDHEPELMIEIEQEDYWVQEVLNVNMADRPNMKFNNLFADVEESDLSFCKPNTNSAWQFGACFKTTSHPHQFHIKHIVH